MKTLILLITTLGLLATAPSLARASETLEVYADSTLGTTNGFLMRITNTGVLSQTVFVVEEAGKVRAYAFRAAGSSVWDLALGTQYLCQSQSMSIGNSWRFLNDDFDAETVATVAAQTNVTTAAGTFSTYRVDIALASAPGTVVESMYFAFGVGFVRDEGFLGGSLDWQDELVSYSIAGGSGFFPLAIGNIWVHDEINLAVETRAWGAIKVLFQ